MPSYKDEKRKSWFSQFYYTANDGTRKLKKKRGFKTKRDADAFERQFLSNQSQSDETYFSALVDDYLDDLSHRVKPTTYYQRELSINKQIRPTFDFYRLNEITPLVIRKWQNGLISSQYKQTTQRIIVSQMSAILNYAVKFYGLKENPIKKTGQIGETKSDSFDFWTVDELNHFIDVTGISDKASSDYHYYVMLYTLFWTGMRNGELLALTPRDIDIKNKTISVSKNFVNYGKEHKIRTPKTKSSIRKIDITQALADLLDDYIKRSMCKPDDRLFPYSRSSLLGKMQKLCDRYNLHRITVHQLRHSHASFCISVLKASPLYIKDRLGHDNINTTLSTYSHLYKAVESEYINEMEKYQRKIEPR